MFTHAGGGRGRGRKTGGAGNPKTENRKPKEIRSPKSDSASSPINAEAQRFAESSSGEKLKLGKQKAEIQRPALSIPSFHISAFCFLLSASPISAFPAFLCVSALSPVPESETAQ